MLAYPALILVYAPIQFVFKRWYRLPYKMAWGIFQNTSFAYFLRINSKRIDSSLFSTDNVYSLLHAFGKEAGFICKLLEAPLYHCISLAEIERRIVLRALEEMGEEAVIHDDLLQVEDDWAHLQEARKHSALPGPIPLHPWIIAREANVLSKTISAHQAFLLNNIRPSYPDNTLLSQSYLTNLEYCTAQWTEIKERMFLLTYLSMSLC